MEVEELMKKRHRQDSRSEKGGCVTVTPAVKDKLVEEVKRLSKTLGINKDKTVREVK